MSREDGSDNSGWWSQLHQLFPTKVTKPTPNHSSGLAADREGNIYITDAGTFSIYKLSPDGIVTTIAGDPRQCDHKDGPVKDALFGSCYGIAVTSDGSLYVADSSNHVIRKISEGVVSTLAGRPQKYGKSDGRGSEASFNTPYGICADSHDVLYVADSDNKLIRKVTMDGTVTTLAGNGDAGTTDGPCNEASFGYPYDLCVDGDNIYVADHIGNSIRKISGGQVTSLKGIQYPTGVTFFGGNLYSVSYNTQKIHKGENFEVLAGSRDGYKDGSIKEAKFQHPYQVVGFRDSLYVSDRGNQCIRRIQLCVEWSVATHWRTPREVRSSVKTIMMLRRSECQFKKLPRDVAFIICRMVGELHFAK